VGTSVVAGAAIGLVVGAIVGAMVGHQRDDRIERKPRTVEGESSESDSDSSSAALRPSPHL
jgi:hypothetical protein